MGKVFIGLLSKFYALSAELDSDEYRYLYALISARITRGLHLIFIFKAVKTILSPLQWKITLI